LLLLLLLVPLQGGETWPNSILFSWYQCLVVAGHTRLLLLLHHKLLLQMLCLLQEGQHSSRATRSSSRNWPRHLAQLLLLQLLPSLQQHL
jgi:hypothetical protein